MKILSTSNFISIAKKISHLADIQYISTNVGRFSDQELRIEITQNLSGEEIIIIGSVHNPVNEHLMEILLMVDAAINAGASKINAIIPYLGYSRQNKVSSNYGLPNSAKLIAKLIQASGVDRLITIDLHSDQIRKFYDIEVENLDPLPIFIDHIKDIISRKENAVIVAPDDGANKRAQYIAKSLSLNMVTLKKTRDEHNICHMEQISGNVMGKNCIIIDDIIDSASTLLAVAEFLHSRGSSSITAFITHAVLSGDAAMLIDQSPIDKIFITDSIPQNQVSSKLHIASIDKMLETKIMAMVKE